jgi:hypothetical protein
MSSSRSIDPIPNRWSTEINAMVYSYGDLLINRYYVSIGFFSTKENPTVNEVAIEKMEIFFNLLFNNSIIIAKSFYDEKAPNIDNNIFMMPDTVNDQSIACLIYLKLCSIIKDDLSIEYITISSDLGKEIEYTIDIDSAEIEAWIPKREEWWKDENIKFEPWWLRDDSATYDQLINQNEIYQGNFIWDEIFKEEIQKIQEDDKKSKFKIINGGKDAN